VQRFKNILLVVDADTDELATLVQAVTLARDNGASLRVLTVIEHPPLDELPLGTRTMIGLLDRDEVREMAERRQRVRLQNQLSALAVDDLDVRTSVESSPTPFLAIIQSVLRRGHDLLIKEARGVTGPRAVLLHPTDRHLMRKCPCPLWMIRPERHAVYQRILAAVDAFSDDEINSELNRRILELASSQSARSGAELHVVHAYGPVSTVPFRSGVDAEAYTKAIVDLHRERLDALLAGCPVSERQVHMEEGQAGDVIPAVAWRERVDLIVMGTVGRVGIPGLFIGNTAETTLDHVGCDVLAVKPRGFVTPVELPEDD
jgi:nucleotide-binding universal stress UspA family protein